MVIDTLQNAARYTHLGKEIAAGFDYLVNTDLQGLAPGKYEIDGEKLFAIVQEYETLDTAGEQMESHKKYIDIQYMISGQELVGHALLNGQKPSKAYETDTDFMLFGSAPSFFSLMAQGTFMIFFPTDLHMPCIKAGEPANVKKVVVKVRIEE
jgi:YhcH/YjgK/YiaL family protein